MADSGRALSCNANGNQTKTKDDDLVKFAIFVDDQELSFVNWWKRQTCVDGTKNSSQFNFRINFSNCQKIAAPKNIFLKYVATLS